MNYVCVVVVQLISVRDNMVREVERTALETFLKLTSNDSLTSMVLMYMLL